MTLELILWIISGIIISEIVYFYIMRYYYDEDTDINWVGIKLLSLLGSGGFTMLQAGIVFGFHNTFSDLKPHYIRLLWEFLIISGIVLFFLFNKWLGKKITKKEDERRRN